MSKLTHFLKLAKLYAFVNWILFNSDRSVSYHFTVWHRKIQYMYLTQLFIQNYEIEMKYKEYQSYKVQKNYSSHGFTIKETSSPAVEMTSIPVETEKISEQNKTTKATRIGDLKVSNIKVANTKTRLPSEDIVGNPDITEELTEAEIIQISEIESSQGKKEIRPHDDFPDKLSRLYWELQREGKLVWPKRKIRLG